MENLVYYNRLKHSKIVISDFHLAKLENGLIKDPCGTPEYLGEDTNETLLSRQMMICDVTARNVDASVLSCSSRGGWQTAIWPACGLLGDRCHHVHTVSDAVNHKERRRMIPNI